MGRGKEELHSRPGEQHKQTFGAWNKIKDFESREHTQKACTKYLFIIIPSYI